MEDQQYVVVRVGATTARAARALLRTSRAYADLSELIEVALANQLALEGGRAHGRAAEAGRSDLSRSAEEVAEADGLLWLLAKPEAASAAVDAATASTEPLFSLTNRLFPIKVAARALANSSDEGLSLPSYQDNAAEAARELGLRLRAADEAERRRGAERRWIALPVGDDKAAALSRYIHSFTLTLKGDGRPTGPLAQLGLAGLDPSGTPALTELGAELTLCENAILDLDEGASSYLLGDDERDLFIHAIRGNSAELTAVSEFIELCRDHAGRQVDIDAALRLRHDGWSNHQAVAHRAAMLGRLRDLRLAEVEGRGPSGRIRLEPNIETYWEET
jgi:hypothetical protein